MAFIAFVIGCIAKKLKRETVLIPFVIAICGIIEFLAIIFQAFLCLFYLEWKYFVFCLVAFFILMIINLANFCYIKTNVIPKDAEKWVKLSQKKKELLMIQ